METTVVSYSDVSSYLRCPRALQLKRAGTPEQDKPVMALGRAMHRLHEAIVAAGWGPEDEEAATTALERATQARWRALQIVGWSDAAGVDPFSRRMLEAALPGGVSVGEGG